MKKPQSGHGESKFKIIHTNLICLVGSTLALNVKIFFRITAHLKKNVLNVRKRLRAATDVPQS